MLFNSIDFVLFLPIVFLLYWFVTHKRLKLQNILIVFSSYLFYGWWDWRFLSLIIFSTFLDYSIGILLSKQENNLKRKRLLWTSIFVNLGFLGIFKYYNFFIENFTTAFSFFGTEIQPNTLNIILPIGISFYTFQTLSYTIDVYKGKLKPTKNFLCFAAFVSFFPQLVAGPIERATNLLPQFYKPRTFDYTKAVDGLRQILWGFFKKIVIADNCAELVNKIFDNSAEMNASTLVLGALFFTFQIYGDFSGYSDIAIGTARLFGFDLKQNFAFPYFSRDVAEFWRRWHISLSRWFRDYLYIPLGGSKTGVVIKLRNTFIIFIVSGFWHGANWTFIFWGFLNALYFMPLLLTKNNRNNLDTIAKGRFLPSIKEVFQVVITFSMTIFTWIFFRAESLEHAFNYIKGIFSWTILSKPFVPGKSLFYIAQILVLILIFMLVEWLGREGKYALEKLSISCENKNIRWSIYLLIGISIFIFGNFNKTEFIYFAF